MAPDDMYTLRGGIFLPHAGPRTGADGELRERIAELEDTDNEWIEVGSGNEFEFSRRFITTITRLAQLMSIKNPLVGRGIGVKADYTFGRGVTIQARDPDIDAVVQAFIDDKRNQTEFASHISRIQRERELQIEGNVFFVLMPHSSTGHVRVRSINVDEITDIICNPDDKKEPWFYRREWIERRYNKKTGRYDEKRRTTYYQDWRYRPTSGDAPVNQSDVEPNQFIFHIKVGGFSYWKFGVSEIYSALDWARAYKTFLENWSTIVAAYARFAFKVTTTGGKQGVAAAKTKLQSTITTTSGERNPPAVTGANIVMQEGNNIEPVRTSGATTKAEDGRRLLLMICAAFGLPETFFGDVSVGTLATARSLDRPTQLMLSNRQKLWADAYRSILDFVVYYAVISPNGPLRAHADIKTNEYGEPVIEFDPDVDPQITVSFPSIVETDTQALIGAIKTAATFDGQTPSILPDSKLLARMVLNALGTEDDVDEIVAQLYPDDAPVLPDDEQDPADPLTDLMQATGDLKQAIEALRETLKPQAIRNGH